MMCGECGYIMEDEEGSAALLDVQVPRWKGEEESPPGWLCRVPGWKGEEELPSGWLCSGSDGCRTQLPKGWMGRNALEG